MINKIYTSYNQINQEFDVVIMNKTDIRKLNDKEQFLVLLPKQSKCSKQPTIRQVLMLIQSDINDLKQWKSEVNVLFKNHGWIK